MPRKPKTFSQRRREAKGAPPREDVTQQARRRRVLPGVGRLDRVRSSRRWQRLRRIVLDNEPLCRPCSAQGRTRAATQVDHIQPIVEAPERAFDQENLQPICTKCHAKKSATERAATRRPSGRRKPKATGE